MPRRHRGHSMDLKRQVVAEHYAGETLRGLSKRHDVCRNLIRVWIAKSDAGEFNDDVAAADLRATYEARIAALERLVGKQALELAFVEEGSSPDPRRKARLQPGAPAPRRLRPKGGR